VLVPEGLRGAPAKCALTPDEFCCVISQLASRGLIDVDAVDELVLRLER
jgi:hypothetical protein